MATTDTIRQTIWEDASVALMARITGADGTAIAQADVSTITYAVYDTHSTTKNTATTSGSVVVADDVFDTLQTDSRWSVDSTGYNFRHDIAATVFTVGGHVYEVEYKFTAATAEVYWVVFELDVKPVRTS